MDCEHCGEAIVTPNRFCGRCGTPAPATRDATREERSPHAGVATATSGPSDAGLLAAAEAAPPQVEAGQLIDGRYQVLHLLGQGGMGAVYMAREVALDRPVAVKLLSEELCGSPSFISRFEREARLTARLDHPNIVPIYGVGRHGAVPYLVMKFLEGKTLSSRIRAPVPLLYPEILAIVRQMSAGLQYIHQTGFVHRDIKGSNVFLSSAGHVTILDFGITRGDDGLGLTLSGGYVGTPQYMAPEQARGAKQIDGRADLYALGVVIFRMVGGRLPFEDESDLALIHAHATLPPPKLAELGAAPQGISAVVDRMLAKDPAQRYQTGGELYAAFEAAVLAENAAPGWQSTQGQALPAGRPVTFSSGTPTSTRAPRRNLAALLGAAGLFLGGVAGLISWSQGRNAEPRLVVTPAPVVAPAPVVVPAPAAAPTRAPAPAPTPAPAVDAEKNKPKPARRSTLAITTALGGSDYYATATIDGVDQGETPLEVPMAPGKHHVHLSRPGVQPVDQDVVVKPGGRTALQIELRR